MPFPEVQKQPGFVRWPTQSELLDALEDRGWDDEPPGSALAWWVSDDWRLVYTEARFCRQPRCNGRAVAALGRRTRLKGGRSTIRWWAYCGDHLYANRIEDGRVIHLRLVDLTEAGEA